ncbi:Protein of unknown function [Rhizobium sp. RU20A]|nr:Protein of unknown function [Rhizobium sp. RU20A]
MFRDKSLTVRLTYLGALPFWLALLAVFAGLPVDGALRVFLGYGAVIAAFMAGTIWTAAHWSERQSVLLLAMSSIIALIVFAVIAVPARTSVAMLVQVACLLALFGLDCAIHRNGDQPKWYIVMRARVTAIVLAAYAGMAAATGQF